MNITTNNTVWLDISPFEFVPKNSHICKQFHYQKNKKQVYIQKIFEKNIKK